MRGLAMSSKLNDDSYMVRQNPPAWFCSTGSLSLFESIHKCYTEISALNKLPMCLLELV